MRGSIGGYSWFLGVVLAVAGAVASDAARGQVTTERFRVSSGAGWTVSVATLRIPEKAWRHFAKAKAAGAHNRPEEVDRETKKALAIAPDFADAYLLRADWELRSHAFEAAIADAKEARRVEPDAMWSGTLLAGAYNGLQRYEDARLVLAGLHGLEAGSWQAAYEGARAAIGLNDVKSGLNLSAVALAHAPEDFPDVHLVRTNAFLRAGRWSEARGQLELYLQSKGSEAHRSAALTALEGVKEQIRKDELQSLASR